MSQYSKSTFSDDQVWTHDLINDELEAIEDAFNELDSTNFASDSIPVTAIINDQSEFILPLTHAAGIGASQAYTDQRNEGILFLPFGFTLVSVSVVAGLVTGSVDLKVYYDGSPATNAISVTDTGVLDSTPTVTSFAVSKKVEIRFESGVGENAYGTTVLLRCKSEHVS